MTIGISKSKVSSLLRAEGITDERIIQAVTKIINKNNDEVERNVKRMIEDEVRYLKR